MTTTRQDLLEAIAPIVAVGALLAFAYQVIAPFLLALVWASILVYATWTPFAWLSRLVRSRGLAAALMVLGFALLIVVPLVFAGMELTSRVGAIEAWYQAKVAAGWPEVPRWIATLPWVGPRIDNAWISLGAGDPEMLARLREWAKPVIGLLLQLGSALGSGFLLMLLSLVFALFIYANGEQLVRWLSGLSGRIAGQRGEELFRIAGSTVRGVVYGFIGTALAQGAAAYFGYWLAGVPNALSFGLVTCLLSIIPGGPGLLGIPVALWLYQQGETGWAIFLGIWIVGVVSSLDNVVKPLLIGKETSLPFLLIMMGVIGGALAWGLLGVFLGPTLLAVCHNVLQRWAFAGGEGEKGGDTKSASAGAAGRAMQAPAPETRLFD
jgi:predicted PurR-regulated permease PerM